MVLLDAATSACVEQAVELCAQLGPLGPYIFMAAAAAVAALFERWRRYQAERRAEDKLTAAAAAAEEKLAKVKAERNEHAKRAQELEVKIASIRPPPMPSSSSSPPDLLGGEETETE